MSSRISTAQMYHNATAQITTAREKETLSSEKAASQKELLRPSQSPSQYMLASHLKDDMSMRDTMAKNASVANHLLTATETIFSLTQDMIQRAHELAVSASGEGAGSEAARPGILPEIRALYDSLIQTLNTKYANRTLLGGHKTQTNAFNQEGEFLGDDGQIEFEISRDLTIPVNSNARVSVLGEGSENGVNVVMAMKTLLEGLESNTSHLIQQSLAMLTKANDQLSFARADLAGRMQQISRVLNTHTEQNITTTDTVSKIEDADAIKVFSDLARDQTVLQSAISTSKKILSENPVDILFK